MSWGSIRTRQAPAPRGIPHGGQHRQPPRRLTCGKHVRSLVPPRALVLGPWVPRSVARQATLGLELVAVIHPVTPAPPVIQGNRATAKHAGGRGNGQDST